MKICPEPVFKRPFAPLSCLNCRSLMTITELNDIFYIEERSGFLWLNKECHFWVKCPICGVCNQLSPTLVANIAPYAQTEIKNRFYNRYRYAQSDDNGY